MILGMGVKKMSNIYFDEEVEKLMDEDAITPTEAAFMHGYDDAE